MPSDKRSRLYLVGLGPGDVGLVTLRGWELLASGNPVLIRDPDHPVSRALKDRGVEISHPSGSSGDDIAGLIVEWASAHDSAVYGIPGHPLEAQETASIMEAAAGQHSRLAVEIVESALDSESLMAPGSVDPVAHKAGVAFSRLVAVMARLRAPGGCPWDREQTHSSLAIHLLDETHEALDAIDREDFEGLQEELGDLLLQIVFHSEIAAEEDHFDVGQVASSLTDKLVGRHPHVFGDAQVEDSREVVDRWEALKHEEKGRATLAEGIPRTLPALLLAHKVQRRLAGAGRASQPSREGLTEKVASLGESSAAEEQVGALLYEVVALAAQLGVDPEGALRRHTAQQLQGAGPNTGA